MRMTSRWIGGVLAMALAGCMCGRSEKKNTCSSDGDCEDGRICESVADSGDRKCAAPFEVRGVVQRESDNAAIEGADVVALGTGGTPASQTVRTGADGRFALRVAVTRDGEGRPQARTVTLR